MDRGGGWARAKIVYDTVYGTLCGVHPNVRPWHLKWLALKDLRRELRRILPTLHGHVLDVGCGQSPYRRWLSKESDYIGLDVTHDSRADVIVRPGEAWPLADASFDAVIATQVLEHASDFENVRREIERVLRPGGIVVISVPFVYNEHGAPEDYRRFSAYAITDLVPSDWRLLETVRLGGIGSTLGILLLDWLDITTSRRDATRIAKGLLMPVWIVFSALVNAVGQLLDHVGDRSAVYVNVLFVAMKPKGA